MHIRRQLINACESILEAGKAHGYWTAVVDSRLQPSTNTTKYLNVYVESEASEAITIHPMPVISRVIEVVVEGRVKMRRDIELMEEQLDELSERIEELLNHTSVRTEINLIKTFVLQSTLSEIDSDDPDRSYGLVTLVFEATAHTVDGQPGTFI